MSLLREIQDAAIDADTPLPVVLRKCMVLAARLAHEPFKAWVNAELNGYRRDADLPAYRRISGLTSIGNFYGAMGAELKNVPLRLAPVPPDLRDKLLTAALHDGVAKLEDLVHAEEEGGGDLIRRWSSDLVAQVAYKYLEGYALLEAHTEIPKSAIVGALDSVRNKVLMFALEIEQQNPASGEVSPGTKPVHEERVSQMFTTIIMGGVQNVAVGSAGAIQNAQRLQAGDIASLKRFLTEQGVQANDLAELESAIAADPTPTADQAFGSRVAGWMGAMISKAASGVWKVGTSTAADVLTAAVKAYYGLD